MINTTNTANTANTQRIDSSPNETLDKLLISKVETVAHSKISTFVQAFKRSLWTVFQCVCLPFALLSPSARKELYFETAAIKRTWNRSLVRIGCADFDSPFTPALLDKAADLLNDPTFNARVFSGRGRFLHNMAQAARLIKHKSMSASNACKKIDIKNSFELVAYQIKRDSDIANTKAGVINTAHEQGKDIYKEFSHTDIATFLIKHRDMSPCIACEDIETHYPSSTVRKDSLDRLRIFHTFNSIQNGTQGSLGKISNSHEKTYLKKLAQRTVKNHFKSMLNRFEMKKENFAEELVEYCKSMGATETEENPEKEILSFAEKLVRTDFDRAIYIIEDGTETRKFSHGKEGEKKVSVEEFFNILKGKVGDNYKVLNTILACIQQSTFGEQMKLPAFKNQIDKNAGHYLMGSDSKEDPLVYSVKIKDETIVIQSTSFQDLLCDSVIGQSAKKVAKNRYYYSVTFSKKTGKSLPSHLETTVLEKIPSSELFTEG